VRRRRPDARIEGVLIEKMMKVEHEVLIGSIKDPVFGPVIVFGLGGTATEIWKDRMIGLPPLNLALAKHLVEGTTVSKLLHGFRHLPAAPLEMLQTVLCRFAYLIMDNPDLREFDINPFAMNAGGGMALDAAGSLERSPSKQREAYEHLSIQPYPSQWQKTIQLRNGVTALLRPIRPEDEPMEAELVKHTSRDSLYFRFFGIVPGMDHKFLSRMTQIDYDREMAIVAEIEEAGKKQIIGVVNIVGDGWRESAEYAILVTDKWQNMGLGGAMTDFILDIARAQGYKTITASFLKTNGNMRRMFVKKGFKMTGSDEDSNWTAMEL
jgi:acetyltransferase